MAEEIKKIEMRVTSIDVPKRIAGIAPIDEVEPVTTAIIRREEPRIEVPREIPMRVVEEEYIRVKPTEHREPTTGAVRVIHPTGYHPLSGLTDEEIDRFEGWARKFHEEHKLTPEQKAKIKAELVKFAKGAKSTVLHFIDSLRKGRAKQKLKEEVIPIGVAK